MPKRVVCIGGVQELQAHSHAVSLVGAVAVFRASALAANHQISSTGNYVGFISDDAVIWLRGLTRFLTSGKCPNVLPICLVY